MTSSFDRCLETLELIAATEEYALRHGPRETPGYRAAWLEFRHRIRTIEDLRGWRPAPAEVNPQAVSVLNAAIERAMLIDEAPMANAQLHDPNDQALRIVAHSGLTTQFLQFFEIVDHASSACGSALASGRAMWVPDTTRSRIFADTPALDVMLDAGIRAVASVPVTSPDGRVIGMISTHHPRPASWTPGRKLRLQGIARSAGRILDYLAPAHRESTETAVRGLPQATSQPPSPYLIEPRHEWRTAAERRGHGPLARASSFWPSRDPHDEDLVGSV